MPEDHKQTEPQPFLAPPPRRYRVRIAIDADDLSTVRRAAAQLAAALDAEHPVVHDFDGGGNWSGALALNPYAPRGADHAQAVRGWVASMPAGQLAGLQRTREKAERARVVIGDRVQGVNLEGLSGLVEVAVSAGAQHPQPAAEPVEHIPPPSTNDELLAGQEDARAQIDAAMGIPAELLAAPEPPPLVLTPDPVVTELPKPELGATFDRNTVTENRGVTLTPDPCATKSDPPELAGGVQ